MSVANETGMSTARSVGQVGTLAIDRSRGLVRAGDAPV